MSAPVTLPPSLNLPPHLSAHKYFMVCTLTVAAWDTLVLSPRTWRLFKSEGWPALKILFHFMRVLMPIEFAIVAVAFFDTKWSISTCEKFWPFEPVVTAFLLAAASAVHVIRIHAIYDSNRTVLFGMGALFAVQVAVTAICCAFFHSVPLLEGQGCIAGPKATWVGIYWIAPTLLYTASLGLALMRSFNSLQAKPLSPWKLMLRDGLNLYGAIWLVNAANVVFWFAMPTTGPNDSIKTIITSMAAVLTTSMTLRIVLSVRGSLVRGGSFALSGTTANSSSSRTTHVISTRSGNPSGVPSHVPHTYTLDDMGMRSKPEAAWDNGEDKAIPLEGQKQSSDGNSGVQVTIDREVGFERMNRK